MKLIIEVEYTIDGEVPKGIDPMDVANKLFDGNFIIPVDARGDVAGDQDDEHALLIAGDIEARWAPDPAMATGEDRENDR